MVASAAGRVAVAQALEAVVEERLVDQLVEAPARLRVGHRQHEPRAAAAEVEAGLGLEHHRQGRPAGRARRSPAAGGRAAARAAPAHGRLATSADHGPQAITSVSAWSVPASQPSWTRTPSLSRAADELAGDGGRVGGAVGGADDRAEHVVGAQAVRRTTGRRSRTGTPSSSCKASSLLQPRQPFLGRGDEQVADLVEERRAELLEEADARLRETNLGGGRELLADAAHRLRRRAARRLAPCRRARRRARRARRGGTRPTRRSRPRPLRRFEPRVQLALLRRARSAAARGRPPAPARRAGRATYFGRGLEREAVERAPQRRDVAGAVADERDHALREDGREAGDGARGAAVEPGLDELLGADEDVEPFEQVRLDRLERPVGDLQARRGSGAASRSCSSTRTGTA